LKEKIRSQWKNDWKYLATDEIMNVPEVNGEFRGLQLPKEVIDRIYRLNAEEWYSQIYQTERAQKP
jgi:hypothetical protein